jgi:hypothetical protein
MVARLSGAGGGGPGLLVWAYEIEKTRKKVKDIKRPGSRKWMDKKTGLAAAAVPVYSAMPCSTPECLLSCCEKTSPLTVRILPRRKVEYLVTCVPGMETQGSRIKNFQISLVPNAQPHPHACGRARIGRFGKKKRTRLVLENYCPVGSLPCVW